MPEGIQIDRKTGGEALPSGDPANAPAEAASNSQTAPGELRYPRASGLC